MTRKDARAVSVCLCFEISARDCDAQEVLDSFFDREYYDTLAGEDELFSAYPDKKQMEYIRRLVSGIGAHSAELDGYVAKYSRGWEFGRISRTALAVIKTAMYEIMYMPDIPNGAAINEAVEIAKGFDEPETVSYVNGILGSFVRQEIVQESPGSSEDL